MSGQPRTFDEPEDDCHSKSALCLQTVTFQIRSHRAVAASSQIPRNLGWMFQIAIVRPCLLTDTESVERYEDSVHDGGQERGEAVGDI